MRTSTVLLAMLLSLTPTLLAAQICKLGAEEVVTACSGLSVTAQWDEEAEEDCTFNPRPGYVVIETFKQVLSSNSGSSSVNVIAGDSNFATEAHFSAVRENLLNMSAKWAGVDYAGQINSKINNAINRSRSYQATNNTVYAVVRASGSGERFNKRRGWEKINVTARVVCIGVPHVQQLTDQFKEELGLPDRRMIVKKGYCAADIYLAYRDHDRDMSPGMYRLENGIASNEVSPIIIPGTGGQTATTSHKFVYVYALSTNGTPVRPANALSGGELTLDLNNNSAVYRPRGSPPQSPRLVLFKRIPGKKAVYGGPGDVWEFDLSC
jgi:hypothetical protein